MRTLPTSTCAFIESASAADLVGVIGAKYPNSQPFAQPTAFLTKDVLAKIVIGINPTLAQQVCDVINEVAPQYGLNRPDVFHEYIAEVAHECQGFTRFVENLNYSAQALAGTWPNRYGVPNPAFNPNVKGSKRYLEDANGKKVPNALALKLQRNPQAIANNCYANRMGNGNEASGDGWRFRGGGGLQLTGADMYRLYGKYKGVADLAFVAEKVRTDLHWAIDSSMWVFVVNKKLLDEAEDDDLDAISHAINGGDIGKEEREKIYKRAVAAMPIK